MKNKLYKAGLFIIPLIVIVSVIIISFFNNEAKPVSYNTPADSTTNIETTTIEETTTIVEETTTVPEFPTSYTKKEYKKLINFDAEFPYMIKINRIQNWVAVYGIDHKGRYSVPYKIFRCSVGREIDYTPTGVFTMSDKYEWRIMVDGSYGRYAMRLQGPIMIHSVPYYSANENDLEVEEYNKLGSNASLGCIRLNVKSVKWIYNHCAPGTTVVIYDSPQEVAPLELPKHIDAVSEGDKAGWDPTDSSPNNPWNKK